MFTVIPQFGMVYIKNNVFKNIILPYYIFHVILRYLKFKYKYVMYLYIFYYHILNFLAISRFCLYLKLVVGVFSVRNISLGGLFIGMIVWTHMFCMHTCAHTHTHTPIIGLKTVQLYHYMVATTDDYNFGHIHY